MTRNAETPGAEPAPGLATLSGGPEVPPNFDDIRPFFEQLPGPDTRAAAEARARQADLLKPPGALGRLEDIAVWLAGWQGKHPARVDRPMVSIFAGNHGVTVQNVTPYPQAVTAQMVASFQSGGAAINQICKAHNAGLKVLELALEKPTGDISREEAMTETDCASSLLYGREAIADGPDLLCLGEMGIGNTTIAAALAFGLFGGRAEDWVGPGTGANSEMMSNKVRVVDTAVSIHATDDPLELLRRVGGREFAAIAGAVLSARFERVPVILDGFGTCAAAAVLHAIVPGALDHCLVGHLSAEPAHPLLLEKMGLRPLLDLGMRLGEGSGAATAIGIVRAAAETHASMATFSEAGVSDRDSK